MKYKIAVIFGGKSVEHEVSIITANLAMKTLDSDKYEVIPIYIDKEQNWYTGKLLMDISNYKDMYNLKRYAKKCCLIKKGEKFILQSLGLFKTTITDIDIAFPIVHGKNVEDGSLAGYLEILGIPYVGSGVLGSAIAQDKVVMKQVMTSSSIPVVPYIWFYDIEYNNDKDDILRNIKDLGYPVIVKPARLGSSIGINKANDEESLNYAIKEAIKYDNKIIVEKVIENLIEVNCSVMGNYIIQQTSVIEEVMGTDEFLSYRDKYLGGSKSNGGNPSKGMRSSNRIIPARISEKLSDEVTKYAKKLFKVFGLSGVCRIDFLIDKNKEKIYVNEPNTIPGDLSLYLWDQTGKSWSDTMDQLITLAVKEHKNENKKITSFDSNILANYGKGSKGIKGSKFQRK